MGYILKNDGFRELIGELKKDYRIFAPVLKKGEGTFSGTDIVRYDFISDAEELELEKKSDYSFKEMLMPLSQTLFFFTEKHVKEADEDCSDVIVFLRSCDMHALRRLDEIYLNNEFEDYYYSRLREHTKFALIGCEKSFDSCFCVDMGSNITEDYMFSVDKADGEFHMDVKDKSVEALVEATCSLKWDVKPRHVTENKVKVNIPENITNSVAKSQMWKEYTTRCINCGRCNFACPTCTCFTMQDIYYTDNGRVGERRRVNASCMVDGYTDVAGGGVYRKENGDRMRFKVLHKVYDYNLRFGYHMCVGCGRCDNICPEYISFSDCINKLEDAVKEVQADER